MRNLILGILICLAGACAHSSAEVKAAREARYTPPAETLFEEVEAAVKASYEIAQADIDRLAMITLERWYNPEGAALGGDQLTVPDGAFVVQLLVEVIEDLGDFVVKVTPITRRVHNGQSQLEEIGPNDANLPGWVTGRVESLEVAIHKRLQGRVVAP